MRNDSPRKKVELTAQHHELRTGRADRRAIVAAEIGDRLEVRHQAAGQPHQLDVALGLALQPPARLDAVEIAVEIDLQQRRGMIGGRPVASGTTPSNPSAPNRVRRRTRDDTNRIVLGDVVFKTIWQPNACLRSSPSTKRFIKNPDSKHQDFNPTNVFTQSGPEGDLPGTEGKRQEAAVPLAQALQSG